MAGIILKLNEIMDALPSSEQKVAVYMVSNLDDIVGVSVEELASRSDSSQAAVVRFCKKMGFKGYREFSIKLASELAVAMHGQANSRECPDLRAGDRAVNVIDSVCRHNMRAIEDTGALIDPDQVELAAGKIFEARRVDVYAVAASHLAALDAQHREAGLRLLGPPPAAVLRGLPRPRGCGAGPVLVRRSQGGSPRL